jgi:predicted amidohydrolase
MAKVRVAACQYPIEPVGTVAAWAQKMERMIAEAARAGAQLLVMPEYAGVELVSVLPKPIQADLRLQLDHLQELLPVYRETCSTLARRYCVYLLAGSMPERTPVSLGPPGTSPDARGGEEFRNRAWLYGPSGEGGFVEKLQMTRFEREEWGIARGDLGAVFDTELGMVGVAICYDCEFPLIVRRLVEHGARVILVPSCNDALSGYWRVRIACQARALENQCYVIQAPTVGSAPWSIALDENRGAAGVYGPPDRGFPETGVIAMGVLDQPGWITADIDLAMVEAVRHDGQVLNHRDWIRSRHLQAPVTRHVIR